MIKNGAATKNKNAALLLSLSLLAWPFCHKGPCIQKATHKKCTFEHTNAFLKCWPSSASAADLQVTIIRARKVGYGNLQAASVCGARRIKS